MSPALPRCLRLAVICTLTLATTGMTAACRCSERGSGLALEGVDRSDGRIPELVAPKIERGAIKIDGRLDEPAWKLAGRTGPFVAPGDGKVRPTSQVNAVAQVAWDIERLYFGFVVHDSDPTSPFDRSQQDPHVWERSSAVELMIQPGDPGNNRDYFEVQVDVAGAIWDTRFDDYNRPITGPPGQRRFGHQQWKSSVERAVSIDKARGRYTVELAFPWRAFDIAGSGRQVRVPPATGDRWRVNLYSFKNGQRDSLAWSPTLRKGNFHRASRFGRVQFGGTNKR